MNSGRATFFAGMVLGIAVGFSAGHLILWRHVSPSLPQDGAARATLEGAIDRPAEPMLAEPDFLPPDLGESVSPLTTAFASQPAPADDSNSETSTDPPNEQGPPTGSAPKRLPTDEPQPLVVAEAAPLRRHTSEKDEAIRELISKELGDVPQAQKDVWFESLRDLPKEDAANVIKLWNRFGAPLEGLSATIDTPGALSKSADPAIDASMFPDQDTLENDDALSRARLVRWRNIALRETPGFKRQIPILIEGKLSQSRLAISGISVRIDFSQGPQQRTDSALDWAIEGDGFFAVTDGQSTFYTRCGRWTIDTEGKLILAGSDPPLYLVGDWQIPAEAADVKLAPDGLLSVMIDSDGGRAEPERLGYVELARFLNSAGLKPRANALFTETSASGPAQLGRAQQGGRGSLRQGVLELSNVDPEEEFLALEDLDALAGSR